MREQWQPYPKHPDILALTRILSDLHERMSDAIASADFQLAKELRDKRQAIRQQLEKTTLALLRDETQLSPRWSIHTKADADSGGIECQECGNNIAATESSCSYCGWTYVDELSSGD